MTMLSFPCETPKGKCVHVGWFHPEINDWNDCFICLDSNNPVPDLYPGEGWQKMYVFVADPSEGEGL